ncbi:uncharacterized protein LOC144714546 [Wolffia australiana]
MGNSLKSGGGKSKVILADCQVVTKEDGSTVAELMMEHPNQFVAELRSFLSSKHPQPLAADRPLLPGRVYLMLHMKTGRAPVSSAAQARRLLSKPRSFKRPPLSKESPLPKLDDSPLLTGRHQSARFSRPWKPTLDPIQEKTSSAKLPRWLLL